jgi:hypothetical protein
MLTTLLISITHVSLSTHIHHACHHTCPCVMVLSRSSCGSWSCPCVPVSPCRRVIVSALHVVPAPIPVWWVHPGPHVGPGPCPGSAQGSGPCALVSSSLLGPSPGPCALVSLSLTLLLRGGPVPVPVWLVVLSPCPRVVVSAPRVVPAPTPVWWVCPGPHIGPGPGPGSARGSGGSCGSWSCPRVRVSSSCRAVTSSLPVQRGGGGSRQKSNTSPDC